MKKYILILVKTAYHKTPYDKWLEGVDITPVFLVSHEFRDHYSHLENVYIFENYDKSNAVVAKALELGQSINIIGVFARAESDILRAAEIRETLGLQGQTLKSAIAFRNKAVMKEYLHSTEVKIARYKKVDSVKSIQDFIDETSFPIVVKPVSESGSTGVTVINNQNDLDLLKITIKFSENEFVAEEFIEGEMYHIDGLVINGILELVQPFKYINDCLEYRKNNFLGGRSVGKHEPEYEGLVNTVKAVLKYLPSPENMAFHAEVWCQPDGSFVFCEIASRSGGATIGLCFESGFKFNVDKAWFLAECGIQTFHGNLFQYCPTGWVVIPPLEGVLLQLPEKTDGPSFIEQSQYCGVVGQRFYGGVKSGLFLAGYSVNGNSETEVEKNIHKTASWFADNTEWDLSRIEL